MKKGLSSHIGILLAENKLNKEKKFHKADLNSYIEIIICFMMMLINLKG